MKHSTNNASPDLGGRSRLDPAEAKQVGRPFVMEPYIRERVSIDPDTECWTWTKAKNEAGYGKFKPAGKAGPMMLVHRYTFLAQKGAIPDGMVLDHLCRNRACCNPAHLEPVTHRENVLRGISPSAVNSRKTHCPQGHVYAGENVAFRKSKTDGRTRRRCKTCEKAQNTVKNARNNPKRYKKYLNTNHQPKLL